MAEDVVGHFLAAVLEEEGGGDVGVREVAAIGAVEQLIHRLAAKAAAFGVREANEARDALRAAELFFVEAIRGEPGDLRGAEARGEDERDAFGGEAGVGRAEKVERCGGGIESRAGL